MTELVETHRARKALHYEAETLLCNFKLPIVQAGQMRLIAAVITTSCKLSAERYKRLVWLKSTSQVIKSSRDLSYGISSILSTNICTYSLACYSTRGFRYTTSRPANSILQWNLVKWTICNGTSLIMQVQGRTLSNNHFEGWHSRLKK